PPTSTLFPYTTLFRSGSTDPLGRRPGGTVKRPRRRKSRRATSAAGRFAGRGGGPPRGAAASSVFLSLSLASGFFPTVEAGGGAEIGRAHLSTPTPHPS